MVEMSMCFNHLLSSNQPADDLEIPAIQLALLDARKRLLSIEEKLIELELAEIEDELQQNDPEVQLLLLRDKQRTYIMKLQGTLSPLRRFPTEILSLIFTFALPSWVRKGVSIDPSSDIWRISQVCRVWRAILCEGMQHLWSSVELDCMGVNGNGQSLIATLLELALQRSGTRPLSIKFYFSHKNKLGVLPESEKRCLAVLANESFRWKEVELRYIPIPALNSLSATVKSHMPLLSRLVIENIPVSLAADTPSTAEAFQVAPKLQHFSLSGYFRPARFYLPWSQLESYAGSFRDFRDFLFILECAGNLKSCDVFLRKYHPGLTVDHPNLRTLRIRGDVVGLSRLRLPSLRTLVLDELLIQDLGNVSTFLRRTPSVTSVEVYIPYDTGAENSIALLSEFMIACTHITSLVLRGELDIRSVCSLLNTSESLSQGQVLMPHLQHLSLSVLSTTNAELANILGLMLESRRRTSLYGLDNQFHRLSSLTLHALREPRAVLERITPLEETLGLKVIVQTDPS
ncbi:hypothetical protein GGU10DRAFT_142614 [Lentinula aff. detonsa]|uniref:F-box domain-containing protein n=1 Tax=Lentinula aff. detonsa TaxID=2804958 RepID=A0AA38L5K5_9AGAR|nr:hypothetical protein GGU10DRAFT_142614 [Lentinula aff. detonsa]